MLYFRSVFIISLSLLSFLSTAKTNNARQIINLISYISKDYQKAVNSNRQVINQDEMLEMEQFIQDAIDLFSATQTEQEITQELKGLKTLILQKDFPEKVSKKAHSLTKDLVSFFKVPTHPKQAIDIELGKNIFNNRCSQCHGKEGQGVPELEKTMNPPPANLRSPDGEKTQTAFSINNTLRTGIPNTAMLPFDSSLTTEELWNVSFYVMSLPQSKNPELKPSQDLELSVEDLANLTDYELKKTIKQNSPQTLAHIRTNSLFLKTLPLTLNQKTNIPLLGITKAQKKISYLQKNLDSLNNLTIKSTLIDAYLEGFEESETSLAIKNRKLCAQIEKSFIKIRSLPPKSPEFKESLKDISDYLKKARTTLTDVTKKPGLAWDEFIASLTIILREGIEAFLIIAALLALINSSKNTRARKFIHASWISALFAGALSYLIFFFILSVSGATRELIEAVSTGVAVALLFYTGYWLLSQSERMAWGGLIKNKAKAAIIDKKLWTIFWLGFVAVYRETAETILFYQALLSTATNKIMIMNGFFVGIAILIMTCVSIQKFQVKIPLKKFFKTTGVMMFIISVILSGKATYEAIEAGYLNHTYIEWLPNLAFLGIYPIKETIMVQLTLLVVATLIYLQHIRANNKQVTVTN
jgi:high-affinity iron transporter